GRSANDYSYDEQALQAIAGMIEGAHAYADHGLPDIATRSVRDIVGFYHDASYIPPSATCPGGCVDATLHILEAAEWLWSMIHEACTLGRPELIGLSIDIFGQWQLNEATSAREVTHILALNSCDIVTRPSAGGSFNRILHSQHQTSKDQTAENPISKGTAMTDTQEQQTLDPTIQETFNHMLEQQHQLEQQRLQLEQLLSQARLEHAGLVLERRLQESVLPQAVKEQIKARYTGRIFEEKDLDTELNSSLNMMARLAQEEGLVRGHNYEKVEISSQITEAEKIQAAFDRMFDLDIDTTRLGNIRGFNGILEAYARVTGDASLFGGISDYSTLGIIRVSESAPITRIKEADTTTASFSYLLGTSMNKRLLKDYQAWPAEWQKFVTIVPIRDFKQQTRVRLGAFGSLPIVAEDTAYQAVTLTDSAATYVAQKRGNLVTVSRETIINDDLQAIKQIPTKLAVAAAYTLAEFVYGFLSSNPGIYDGNNLFTSGVPHNNLGSSALSTAAMQTGITAMREQTNYAGKRLGLRPRYLVVPPELEWTAMVATKSAGVPGSNANDINPMLGYVLPIVSPQLTSTTQWFLVGDPKEIDVIEVGFVGGQVNPVLLIQDSPLLGLNFSQDAVSYKCRHEFGGAVVDFRGTYRGV
ncbi:MAG TPA: Mu-like prophage major head subunit gpT family protein, partial [Ktedonobacteraceae bacterium]|nr:Mu-like prophage major head subunit gpT family protein [Ktedonobacteraceae bacterium]